MAEHVKVRPVGHADRARSVKRWFIWGIACLAGPTILIIITLFLFGIVNFVLASVSPGADAASMDTPSDPLTVILNIVLFMVGAFAVLALLPGIIIGIIILSRIKE